MQSGLDSKDPENSNEQKALDNQLYSLIVNYDANYQDQFFASIRSLVKRGASLEQKDEHGISLYWLTEDADLRSLLEELSEELAVNREAEQIRFQHINEEIYYEAPDIRPDGDDNQAPPVIRDPLFVEIDDMFKARDEEVKREQEAHEAAERVATENRVRTLTEYLPKEITPETANMIFPTLEEMKLEHLPKDMQEVIQSQFNEIFTNYKIYLETFRKMSPENIERISDLLAQDDNAAASFYKLANNSAPARSSATGIFSVGNSQNSNLQNLEQILKPEFDKFVQSLSLISKVSDDTVTVFTAVNEILKSIKAPNYKTSLDNALPTLKVRINVGLKELSAATEKEAL